MGFNSGIAVAVAKLGAVVGPAKALSCAKLCGAVAETGIDRLWPRSTTLDDDAGLAGVASFVLGLSENGSTCPNKFGK